jgi:phosphate butyryltransferase
VIPLRDFDGLLLEAAAVGPVAASVAAPEELEVLLAVHEARKRGILDPVLIGDAALMGTLARQNGLDLTGFTVLNEPEPAAAAKSAMRLAAEGHTRLAIKGQVQTSEFLKAALRREAGLRTASLVSHVGIFEVPGLGRLLFIADGGVVLQPSKEQKIEIIAHAISVAQAMGVKWPRVALLASCDQIRAELPVTTEIGEIIALRERWQDLGAYVEGPFLLDTALSESLAVCRGRSGCVGGKADVLVGPDVESVNIMAKGITYFAHGRMAGLVVGARVPLVVGSRADPPETRLACMAAGALLAARAA